MSQSAYSSSLVYLPGQQAIVDGTVYAATVRVPPETPPPNTDFWEVVTLPDNGLVPFPSTGGGWTTVALGFNGGDGGAASVMLPPGWVPADGGVFLAFIADISTLGTTLQSPYNGEIDSGPFVGAILVGAIADGAYPVEYLWGTVILQGEGPNPVQGAWDGNGDGVQLPLTTGLDTWGGIQMVGDGYGVEIEIITTAGLNLDFGEGSLPVGGITLQESGFPNGDPPPPISTVAGPPILIGAMSEVCAPWASTGVQAQLDTTEQGYTITATLIVTNQDATEVLQVVATVDIPQSGPNQNGYVDWASATPTAVAGTDLVWNGETPNVVSTAGGVFTSVLTLGTAFD